MPPDPRSQFDKITVLVMSVLFLAVVLVLIILVGIGRLDFGVDPSLAFLLYIIAGLLVAFACFGILTSSGELRGNPLGVQVRLGGAVVAAVVIAGGGSLYEIYVRPSDFVTRVMFYESDPAIPIPISGTLEVIVGAEPRQYAVESNGTVLVQNLRNKEKLRYLLRSPEYQVDSSERRELEPTKNGVVLIKVSRKPLFEPYASSNLDLSFESAFVDHAPRDTFSVTMRVTAIARAERPIPLRTSAVAVLTKAQLPYRSFSADVGNGLSNTILIEPGKPELLFVNFDMPSDFAHLIHMGLEVVVKLQYSDSTKADGGEYELAPVLLNSKTFPVE